MRPQHFWMLLILVGILIHANFAQAATTYLDGVGAPTLLDSVLLDDFNNEIGAGWVSGANFGEISHVAGTLTNTNPTTGAFPVLRYFLAANDRPDVSPTFTLGDQPGEFNVLQFDLRYDSLPSGLASEARGLQVFLGQQFGSQASANVFVVNNSTNTLPPIRNDTVPQLPLDGQWHTYTVVRNSSDTGWGQMYEILMLAPILHESSIGNRFSLDNVILARAVPEPAPCAMLVAGAMSVLGCRRRG